MTNEQINRRISELREPQPQYRDGILGPSIGGAWYYRDYWRPEPVPVDWTGSEDVSAVLRNELKAHFPYFSITFNREWHTIEFEASGVEGGFAIDIPTDDELVAVAKAWLKWKEHPQ